MTRRLVLALLCATALGSAHAEESRTLRKIREAGVITLGYREDMVPLSYLNQAQRPIGYSVEICDRIVDAVKARLGAPDLERRYVPVVSATRIPMVANGTIDLECGVTTNTVERQKQVAFTITTFVAASRLVSKKTDPVQRVEDLRGKVVTSTVGTTSLRHLQDLYADKHLEMTIVASRDDADAFRLLEADRATAYAMDDVLLRGMVARSRHPAQYLISADTLSVEPYGIMLSKDDPEFKRLADQTIVGLFRSGEIHRIYRRWFESPIPPSGINLGLPMHPAMKRVIEHPTDSPDPAVYR
jgi:glutamate/aspartate transport system substrate-binding protein